MTYQAGRAHDCSVMCVSLPTDTVRLRYESAFGAAVYTGAPRTQASWFSVYGLDIQGSIPDRGRHL